MSAPTGNIKARRANQYIAALGATIGGLALGTAIGWSAPAQEILMLKKVQSNILYLVSSIMTLGAAVALFVLLFIFDLVGRRWIMIGTMPPFVAAWVLLGVTQNNMLLVLGRFISGFAGAVFCVATPTFTAELAEKEIRGTLGVGFQLFVNIGILIVYCEGEFDNMYVLTFPNVVFPILSTAILLFVKETPVYLLKKGKEEEAIKSLQFYRGKDYDCTTEIAHLSDYSKIKSETFLEVFKRKSTIRASFMLLGLHTLQQLTGINAILFYAHQIFEDSGSRIDSGQCAIVLGVVMVLSTFLAVHLVDKIGRKLLWLISLSLMGACLLLLSLFFVIKQQSPKKAWRIGWLPLASVCFYIVGFFLGAGPLPWVMLAELLPSRVKGLLGNLIGSFNWLLAFGVTMTFNHLQKRVGKVVVYLGFAVCCGVGFIFVMFFVIETKNKTLEDIQKELAGEIRNA